MKNSENTGAGLPAPTFELLGFPAGAFQTNCYVLINTDESVAHDEQGRRPATVVDPGHGAHEVMSGAASEHNFYVESIVLTHGHIDHMRDAAEFGVPVHVHEYDRSMLENPGMYTNFPDFARIFDTENMRVPEEIRNLSDEISIGGQTFTVHHMPGHSPGSVMFRIPGLILGGDVLFNGGVGRTDLPGSDPADMTLSLKRLSAEFDNDDVVLPGHGPQTTIGQEKKTNPFLHEVG